MDFIYYIPITLFDIIKSAVRFYYLHAPRWAYGHQNLPLLDVCAIEMKVSTAVLLSESGAAICEEGIDNILVGYTTIVISAIVAICVYSAALSAPQAFKFFLDRKNSLEKKEARRISALKAQITRKYRDGCVRACEEVKKVINRYDLPDEEIVKFIRLVMSESEEKQPPSPTGHLAIEDAD